MKLFSLPSYLFVAGLLALIQVGGCTSTQPSPVAAVKSTALRNLDSLRTLLGNTLLPLAEKSSSADSLQEAFRQCRLAYKKVEFITEYFTPTGNRFVNGPPLDEIETGEYEVNEPGGLQVIEEYLFPALDTTRREGLVREVKKLQAQLRQTRILCEAQQFTDGHVFDAARLEVFRIITLGITGFDTPLAPQHALSEAAASLSSLQTSLQCYGLHSPSAYPSLQQLLSQAIAYLQRNNSFDTFDRMYFITRCANPISTQLKSLQTELGITLPVAARALRTDAKTLFEADAFNPDFYAPDRDSYGSADKVILGKRLFFDPVLSSDHSRSCASCHQPTKSFTDGLPKSAAFTKGKFIARNAPTLINAGLQGGQFYDLRSTTLEHQAMEVVQNQDEMHGSLTDAARSLSRLSDYLALFRKAYPSTGDSILPSAIQNALASYVRSLTSLNSPFDQYVRGDYSRLTAQEAQGFNVFMGKAKCATCHFMPLFNGTVPPGFTQTEAEVLGVPAQPEGKKLDMDLGRYAIHPFAQLKHAFKTPTLRNIAMTAPYMHNGVYATLEEVVDFYDGGGGAGLGFDLPNQTLAPDSLHLTTGEKKALVAFMKTLTDTSVTQVTLEYASRRK
jgi:cytochrome c peroxidase